MTGSPAAIAVACQRAGAVLAAARAEREAIAMNVGAEAVAQWASPNGTPQQQEELAAYYVGLQAQAGGSTAA